ncbi:MAG: LPS export ABC transporter periplasmic protein LptC [Paracoccaceae bacterium]
MDPHLSSYSRLVFWLKITLPILGLAILSTLFLFARRVDFQDALPYADVDVSALAKDPRLTGPEYAGVTDDGATVRVAASVARPGATPEDPITASDVLTIYQLPGGVTVTITSAAGNLNQTAEQLTLEGDVVLNTSDGYQMNTEQMISSLATTDVFAPGDVVGTAPFGRINADSMRLSGPAGKQRLVFDGSVRLIYEPQK